MNTRGFGRWASRYDYVVLKIRVGLTVCDHDCERDLSIRRFPSWGFFLAPGQK